MHYDADMPPRTPLRQRRGYALAVTTAAALFWGLVIASQMRGPQSLQGSDDAPHPRELAAAPADPGLDRAEQAAAASHERLRRATSALEGFLADHFARLPEEASPSTPAAPAPAPTSVEPLLIPNPKWQELSARLRALEAQQAELTNRVTAEHPQLVQLNEQLASQREQLASVPQMIAVDPQPDPQRPSTASVPTGPPAAAVDRTVEHLKAASSYGRLWREFADSLSEFERAQADYRFAMTRQLETSRALARETPEPQPVATGSGRQTWWTFASLVAAMAVTAGAVSMLTRSGSAPEVLSSVAQVESILRLPVVGYTADAAELASAPAAALGRLPRGLLILAEASCALAIVGVVMLAARQGGIPSQLWHDPVAAVGEGIAVFTSGW